MNFKSPINWFGGKYYMANDIIKLFPEHKYFVEVFGGAGHILFKKERSPIEVYNDINEGLYLFFKTLRDENKKDTLISQLQLTNYGRQEFMNCKDSWQNETDDIEKARKFYVATMQSVGCNGGWCYAKTGTRRGMSQAVSRWLGNVDENMLNAIERLREIQIENLDFQKCIEKYDSEDTLFYLDPPYIHETRSYKKGYKYEMETCDHIRLVNTILSVKGRAILSGYDHEIYQPLENGGWKKILLGDYMKSSMKNNDGNLDTGKEFIWINF